MDLERLNKRLVEAWKRFGYDRPPVPVFPMAGGHDVFDLTQQSFRGRVDDSAADSSPSWIAALNTNWTQDTDSTFRIRFLVIWSGVSAGSGTFGGRLQYNLASGGWNNVTSSSPIQAAAGAVTDGRATGQVLGSGTNVAGEYDEVDGNVADISIAANEETEVEYNLTIDSAQVTDAQTFQLRVVGTNDDSTVLEAYTNTPTITVNEVVPPVYVQEKFRFRYDDGSETTANWIDAEDTDIVWAPDINIRLRFSVRQTAAVSVSPTFQLQLEKNGTGGFSNVTTTTDIRGALSSEYAPGATTEQLDGAGTFTAGRIEENDDITSAITLNNQDTEVEFCLTMPAASVTDTDFYDLRLVIGNDSDAAFDTYTVTPRATVSELSTPTQLDHTEFPKQNYYCPPFEVSGGNKYLFKVDQGGHWLVAMKATTASPVNADWAMQDTGTFLGKIECVYVAESGGDYHIAIQQTTGRVSYHVFDPGTDAWTVEDEAVAHIGDSGFDNLPDFFGVAFDIDGNSDVKLVARYNNGSTEQLRGYRRNGSWVQKNTIAAVGGIVAGGVNTGVQVVFFYFDNGSAIRKLSFNDDDTLTSSSNVDTTYDTASSVVIPGAGDALGLGGYIDGNNQISLADNNVSVTNISDNTVYGHGRTTAPFVAACLVMNGTDLHLIYVDDTTQNIRHSENLGSGWGNDTEIDNPTGAVNRISARINNAADAILYVYEEGSTCTYGSFSLVDGGVNVAPGVTTLEMTINVPTIETGANIGVPVTDLDMVMQTPVVASGVNLPIPVTTLELTIQDPAVAAGASALPPVTALELVLQAPTVETGVEILPPVTTLELILQVPVIQTGVEILPGVTTLEMVLQTPAVGAGASILPGATVLEMVLQTPTVETGVNIDVPVKALELVLQTPAVGTSVDVQSLVTALELVFFAPDIVTGAQVEVLPGVTTLEMVLFAPAVAAGEGINVPVTALELVLQTPTIETGANISVPVTALELVLQTPTIETGVEILPGVTALEMVLQTPAVAAGEGINVPLTVLEMVLFAPDIVTGQAVEILPGTTALEMVLQAPTVAIGANAAPGVTALEMVLKAPTIETGVNISVPATTLELVLQTPAVGVGVDVDIPVTALEMVLQAPTIETGVNVDVPVTTLEMVLQTPTVASGVTVDVPVTTLELTLYEPVIPATGGVEVTVPAPTALEMALNVPRVDIISPFVESAGIFDINSLNRPQVPVFPYGTILTDRVDGNAYLVDIEPTFGTTRMSVVTVRNGLRVYPTYSARGGPVINGYRMYSENQQFFTERVTGQSVSNPPVHNLTADKDAIYELDIVDGEPEWTLT